ncbi:MAG: transposase [Bryobacterales bacterium]|nr:transposase [Bryobacterales bacterium]
MAPNDVWCIDFKGWLRTGDGAIGYPLTVTDAFSRYLLCCCGLMPDYEGRHERMHKTLKAETAHPPAATLAGQQRRFEQFRAEFNHERPHQALGQAVPSAVYTPASRPYPARLADPTYASDCELRRVRSNGEIKWQGELIFIAQPLVGEVIGLQKDNDGNAEVYFGPVHLGTIDGVTLKLEACARRPIHSRTQEPEASCPQGPQSLGTH